MSGTKDQASVEQTPQAGPNPAAPAGAGTVTPAQDTSEGGASRAVAGPSTPEDPVWEAPRGADAAGSEGEPRDMDGPGDPTPGGVPPDGAATGSSGGDGSPAPPSGSASVVLVRGPAKGRWRLGRRFGPEPTPIPLSELDEESLAALRGDPELTAQVA